MLGQPTKHESEPTHINQHYWFAVFQSSTIQHKGKLYRKVKDNQGLGNFEVKARRIPYNLGLIIIKLIKRSKLFPFQTYHEVIDEIYYKVDHLEPWERGSRKTSGQTGMCGGVRGVGAGGK